MPIYPGALVQIITLGSAEFQIEADMQTVEKYYDQHLTSSGWAADGAPNEASGNYLQMEERQPENTDSDLGTYNITI